MNDLIYTPPGGGAPVAMSTREIAELCDKQHLHVLRDTEAMFKALEIDPEGYIQFWIHPQNGQSYREFLLPKDLTLTLVAGYNIQLRHRIVKRLEEMEAAAYNPIAMLNDPAAMRGILLSYTEKVLELESKVEADAPKVAFAEQVEVAPDAISLGQAAKIPDTGRNRLCSTLRQIGWLTRTNEPYQSKIEAGLLDVKIGSWDHPEKGLQRSVTALVTGKGLAKLHSIVAPQASASH